MNTLPRFTTAALLGFVMAAHGAPRTWSGAGANNGWMTASNWVGNVAPLAGDDLFFPPGAMRNVNHNDFPAGTTFNSIAFSGLAYSISGNALALNAGLVATNGSTSVINNLLILNSNQTFAINMGGSFSFSSSSAIDLNGRNLTFDLGFAVIAQVQATISGTGGLIRTGSVSSALNLYASNTFSGPVEILQGGLNLYHSNALGSAAESVTIAEAGTLVLLNFITLSKRLALTGALRSAGGGTKILNGPISLSASNATIEAASGAPLIINGVISGTGGFTAGSGGDVVTLNADNTYTGATTIFGQTLRVNGSQPLSPIILSAGALGGTGTVGTVTATSSFSKSIAPGGPTPGILNSSNVTLSSSTTFTVRLNGPSPGSDYDQLNVTGSVTLSNATLSVTTGFNPAVGSSFTIIANDGNDPVIGAFSGLPEGAILAGPPSGALFQISYAGGDGNDVVLTRILPLLIQRAATDSVRLLWPTNGAAGFDLLSNTNLNTTNWIAATPPAPVVAGTNWVVTNAPSGHQMFYRLFKP